MSTTAGAALPVGAINMTTYEVEVVVRGTGERRPIVCTAPSLDELLAHLRATYPPGTFDRVAPVANAPRYMWEWVHVDPRDNGGG